MTACVSFAATVTVAVRVPEALVPRLDDVRPRGDVVEREPAVGARHHEVGVVVTPMYACIHGWMSHLIGITGCCASIFDRA